jgi:hypothetical protein
MEYMVKIVHVLHSYGMLFCISAFQMKCHSKLKCTIMKQILYILDDFSLMHNCLIRV